jgi:transposase-like protein
MAEMNMANLTVTMTKEERKALKQIALDNDITVSALIRLWIQEHQEVEVKG